jgi:glycosyltransferase involved in cell wall biosynthesis
MLDAAYADWTLQSRRGDEFVVVHDGSRSLRCPGVAVVCSAVANLGVRRNLGVAHATGDVIAVWDDDDGHERERLAEQLEPIDTGCDASVIRDVLLEATGKKACGWMPCGWPQTLVVTRDALLAAGRWPEDKRWDDDIALLMRLRTRFVVRRIESEKLLYRYRQHDSNVTGSVHWDAIWQRAIPLSQSPWAEHVQN